MRTTASRSSRAGSPMPTARTRSTGSSPAAASAVRVALAGQLPERGERRELAAGAPVELAERPIERRVADDGDDEDVGRDIPWLVGDDAKLHGCGSSRVRGRAGGASARGGIRADVRRSVPYGSRRGRRVGRSGRGTMLEGVRRTASQPALASSIAMTAPFIPPRPMSDMITTRPRVSAGRRSRAAFSAAMASRTALVTRPPTFERPVEAAQGLVIRGVPVEPRVERRDVDGVREPVPERPRVGDRGVRRVEKGDRRRRSALARPAPPP